MTSGCLPSVQATQQMISCRVHLINMVPSLPLVYELLLQETQRASSKYPLKHDTNLVSAIAETDVKRREFSDQLLKHLSKVTNGIIDSYTVSQVEQLMEAFHQVSPVCLSVSHLSISVFSYRKYLTLSVSHWTVACNV